MYKFYFDGLVLPVTPGKLTTKIKNKNKTIDLINEGEMNVLKTAGLTEYSFKFMLPKTNYPFCNPSKAGMLEGLLPALHELFPLANISGLFPSQKEWLKILNDYKAQKKPFQFKVLRLKPGVSLRNISYNNLTGSISYSYFDTNTKVTIEDYTITEDANELMDVWVDIKLKIYVPYTTHTYTQQMDYDGVYRYHRDDDYIIRIGSDVNPTTGKTKKQTFWDKAQEMLGW